jgi:hypothetical protein
MSARLAGALVTRERALKTQESSYVLRAAKPFLIHVGHGPLSAVRHMTAPEHSLAERRGSEPHDIWKHRSPPIGEAGFGATRHVAMSEPSLAGRRDPVLQGDGA